ncbi:MAG: vWA domain-containing protein [Thiotrichales bacterium]
MTDYALLQPLWLLLIPFMFVWLVLRKTALSWPRLVTGFALRYPLLGQIPLKTSAITSDKQRAQLPLLSAFILLIIALAQPVHFSQPIKSEDNNKPVDAVLVVSTAISMRLQDYQFKDSSVSRLAIAQRFLQSFIEAFSGERLALVVMGTPSTLWLPLTSDRQVVEAAVNRLRPVLGGRLADMGAALRLVAAMDKTSREKIILLVTDGGLQTGKVSPEEAARKIHAHGYSLNIIGIGAPKGKPIAQEPGSLIYQSIDRKFLRGIAEAGGGEFFHIQNPAEFSQVIKQIESALKQDALVDPVLRLQHPLYPWFVGIALMLLLYSFVVTSGGARLSREKS